MTDAPAPLKKKRRAALIKSVIIVALGAYLIFGVLLYTFQRSFLYPGVRLLAAVGTPEQAGVTGLSDVRFLTLDGLQLHAWYAPASDFGKPTILFFHGNGSNIKGFLPKAQVYLKRGYGVFLCEYRGYGGNPGSPTEQGLYNDAEACLFALKDKGYGSWNLIYYGESLGSGVAVELAAKYPPKALVLECPYSSVVDIGKLRYGWYPVDWLMKDRFDSVSKITKVKSRVLIVHGDADGVVPFKEGARLFDRANQPKEFYAIAGGHHGDLYTFGAGDIIAEWLTSRRIGMYVPTKSYPGPPLLHNLLTMNEITVMTEDDLKLYAWFAPPREKGGRIIVHFHGNMGNLADLRNTAESWLKRGFGVYLCEYRGYGGNPGNPSEEGIYRDARAGIGWLKQQGYDPAQFVYYGFSMGASVAIQMATETEPGLMVLESSGSNAIDVLNWQRPTLSREAVAAFVTERFENLEKMPKIHAPVLFMHGEKDDVVPVQLARKLFNTANEPKYFKSFPEAGHSDMSLYGARALAADWIEQNSGSKQHATAK